MLSIIWFLALGILCQSPPAADGATSPLTLYQQAAVALQADRPLEAIPLLQQLVSQQADAAIAPLAAARLAECFLATDNFAEAVKLLLTWTPRILKLNEGTLARRLDPSISERATFLTKSALAQLPQESLSLLEQRVKDLGIPPSVHGFESPDSPLQPTDGWVLAELARRYASQQRLSESYQLLVRLGPLADARAQKLRELHIPLAILLHQPTEPMIEIVTRTVEHAKDWSLSETLSAKLAIAEAERQLGKLEEACSRLSQLAVWLDQQVVTDRQIASAELVKWKATVDLRQAELMLVLNRHQQAAQLVERCLENYPSYPDLAQFRLLAARCCIAEIEFEAARDQLRKLIDDPFSKPVQIAQAMWMQGEVSFLQRDYATAILQYKRVLQVADQPAWYARALVQMAKCYELQGAPLDALSSYRAVVNAYPQSEVAETARNRLEQLTSWTDNPITPPEAAQSAEYQQTTIQR